MLFFRTTESWKQSLSQFLENLSSTTLFNIENIYWAANWHIRMISEWSCDTEDWSKIHKNQLQLKQYYNWK